MNTQKCMIGSPFVNTIPLTSTTTAVDHKHSLQYTLKHCHSHSTTHHILQTHYRYMQLHFIREGDGYAEAYFARYLIEDRANFSGGGMSYTEYHAHVSRAVSGMPG